MEPNAPPDSAVGGLRVKIRSGSVCRQTKRRAIYKNLRLKDIVLMWFLSHSGIQYNTASRKKKYCFIKGKR